VVVRKEREIRTETPEEKQRREDVELLVLQERADIQNILKTNSGKRVITMILVEAGLFTTPKPRNATTDDVMYNTGKNDIGRWLYSKIIKSCRGDIQKAAVIAEITVILQRQGEKNARRNN
jgi:hypothetical protein